MNLTDSKQLPRIALMAAGLLLLATVGWHLQRRLSITAEAPPPAPAGTPAAAPSAPDMTVLSQWQPYGAPPAPDAPESTVVAPSPLNLQLHGVVAAKDGQTGEAIIADESGTERAYSVGDTIADGVMLQAVNARDIVIKRGDQLESIRLPEVPSAGGGEAPPLPEATNIPPPTPPAEETPPAPAPVEQPPAAAPPAVDGNPDVGAAPSTQSPPPPPAGTPGVPDASMQPPPAQPLPPGNQ